MLNGLDLFSGIGGLTLALSEWVKPVAYCEIDRYAQGVLLSRMADMRIPRAPIWGDIRHLSGSTLPTVNIIYGGFPCQDISAAGRGAGLEGKRSGLFFEIIRLTEEIKPEFVFLENVPAIRTRGLREVIRAFTNVGYDCRWTRLSAASVGAPHLRERWFMLAANAECLKLRVEPWWRRRAHRQGETITGNDGEKRPVADDHGQRGTQGIQAAKIRGRESDAHGSGGWNTEPDVGRVVNGFPYRVDRVKGLGNAVVPAQAREAFARLIGFDKAP